ncbi:MAG: S26 family signal peptidase [Polyangiaceae bacterium]
MKKFLRVVLWCLVIVIAVCVGLYLAVFDVWIVPKGNAQAASVQPTLWPGDVVLVSRKGTVEGERLVRCEHPTEKGTYVVARAYGYPGSKLSIESELVVVDGKRWTPRESCIAPRPLACASEFGEGDSQRNFWRDAVRPKPDISAVIQPSKLFLVSDQRHDHYDSRDYGAVDLATCKVIVWKLVAGPGSDLPGHTGPGTPIP